MSNFKRHYKWETEYNSGWFTAHSNSERDKDRDEQNSKATEDILKTVFVQNSTETHRLSLYGQKPKTSSSHKSFIYELKAYKYSIFLWPAFQQSLGSNVPTGSWMSPAGTGGMFAGWGKWRRCECVRVGCSGCCCGRWRCGWTVCFWPARYCPPETPDGSGQRLLEDVSHGHSPNLQKSYTLKGIHVVSIQNWA